MLRAVPHTKSETSKGVSLKTSTLGRACKEDSDYASGFDQTIFDNIGPNEPHMAEDTEPSRKHKALCYEDIIFWIVKDPKMGERDVLAIEGYFRHHKGADNKPKPYVSPFKCPSGHTSRRTNYTAPYFCFGITPSRFCVP